MTPTLKLAIGIGLLIFAIMVSIASPYRLTPKRPRS